MNNNNTGAWVAGIIIVILIIVGLVWWSNSGTPVTTNTVATTTTATTTTTAATTTTGTPVIKESRTTSTVAQVVASLSGASTFASYLLSTGVGTSITGVGPYTVFVPTNAAFGKLAAGTVSGLSVAAKKRLIQYHIVSGKKLDVDALETSTIMSLSRDMLNFQALGPQFGGKVNNSVVIHQYNAKNGVVYTIDAVLIPPQAPLN